MNELCGSEETVGLRHLQIEPSFYKKKIGIWLSHSLKIRRITAPHLPRAVSPVGSHSKVIEGKPHARATIVTLLPPTEKTGRILNWFGKKPS